MSPVVGVGSPVCSPACSSQQTEARCNCSSADPCEEESDCPGSALSCRLAGPDKERMRMRETSLETSLLCPVSVCSVSPQLGRGRGLSGSPRSARSNSTVKTQTVISYLSSRSFIVIIAN